MASNLKAGGNVRRREERAEELVARIIAGELVLATLEGQGAPGSPEARKRVALGWALAGLKALRDSAELGVSVGMMRVGAAVALERALAALED
jgi:hypothetical protein